MSEKSLILNESSQANYLNNLNRLTSSLMNDRNGQTIEDDAINQRNETNNEQTKLTTKHLFTVDSLLKSGNSLSSSSNSTGSPDSKPNSKDDLKLETTDRHDSTNPPDSTRTTDRPVEDDAQRNECSKSDSEELNVDKDDSMDAESIAESLNESSNQPNDKHVQPTIVKNSFHSIKELYKTINQTDLYGGSCNQPITNSSSSINPMLNTPSSSFLSNLPFANHDSHFQALLASHLAPYTSAFNAAFNQTNSLYLNNLIHQTPSCQQSTSNPHSLQQQQQQQQSTTSPSSLSACPTVLEDNLRQALLAAQSNSVNKPDTTPKHAGHSLNFISLNSSKFFFSVFFCCC